MAQSPANPGSSSGSPSTSNAPPTAAPNAAQISASSGATKQRIPALFRVIQLTSLVLGTLAISLAAYYYLYSRRQQDYLALRNQRALVTLTAQLAGALGTADQVLRNFELDTSARPGNTMLEHLAIVSARDSLLHGSDRCLVEASSPGQLSDRWESRASAAAGCLERRAPAALRVRVPAASRAVLDARSLLRTVVAEPVTRRIVDAAILADTNGLVLVQAGPSELMVHHLERLLGAAIVDAKSRDARTVDRSWRTVRGSATRVPVLIGQHAYDLYVQPCCSSVGGFEPQSIVVAALVRKGAFVRRSLQISYTVVAGLLAVMLLAATSAPFLKLQLMGEFQRVTAVDVVALAFCTILSLSVSTVVALDIWAYQKLKADLGMQTRRLGDSIAEHLTREIAMLHHDLRVLAPWARERTSGQVAPRVTDVLGDSSLPVLRAPRFESWTLIDAKGQQRGKWSFDAFTQPNVPVAEREYFRAASAGRGWPLAGVAGRAAADSAQRDTLLFVESLQSWTTGRRQAILAMPTRDPTFPVAALTISLASVIDPVIAPQFGFAVIDQAGRVLFHSDKTRNLYEGFFAEADHSRAIRSATFARTAVLTDLRYGGEDHTAYVRPVDGTPWTVVTLLERKPTRVTNLETIGTTMMLVLTYALVMLALGLTHVLLRRERRLSWIWPDRVRHEDYARLAMAYSLLILAFLIAHAFLRGSDLAMVSGVLPILSVILTWGVLRIQSSDESLALARRRRFSPGAVAMGINFIALARLMDGDHPVVALFLVALAMLATLIALEPSLGSVNAERFVSWPVSRRYLLAATLFLLLTSVLPAAGFFQVAHRLHMQAYIRHGQLRLAASLEQREARLRSTIGARAGTTARSPLSRHWCRRDPAACDIDLYQGAFFDTELLPATAELPTKASESNWMLPRFIEPYETEASVERRPMLKYAAGDSSWHAAVAGDEGWLRVRGADGTAYVLRSRLPSLAARTPVALLGAMVITAVLVGLAWMLATFLARRLFLIDLLDARPVGDLTVRERVRRNLVLYATGRAELDTWIDLSAFAPSDPDRPDVVDFLKPPAAWLRIVADPKRTAPVILRWPPVASVSLPVVDAWISVVERLLKSQRSAILLAIQMDTIGHSPSDRRARFAPTGDDDWNQRVSRLLAHFVPIDAMRTSGQPDVPPPNRLTAPPKEITAHVIAAESVGDPRLGALWAGLSEESKAPERFGDPITTSDELLDRLGERAEVYFDSLWASCSRDEKAVLVHLAEDRFPNSKDRAVLRRLLTRGLLRRTPRLSLLNETFQRYVITRGGTVEARVERERERSVWDGVKWPIASIIVLGLIFFVLTQQEFFTAANGVVVGLTTTIPAFIRLITWIGERRLST